MSQIGQRMLHHHHQQLLNLGKAVVLISRSEKNAIQVLKQMMLAFRLMRRSQIGVLGILVQLLNRLEAATKELSDAHYVSFTCDGGMAVLVLCLTCFLQQESQHLLLTWFQALWTHVEFAGCGRSAAPKASRGIA